MDKLLGIPSSAKPFHKLEEGQDREREVGKTNAFLWEYRNLMAKRLGCDALDIDIKFINYGSTELVYVATFPDGTMKALLVSQPIAKEGAVAEEFENLCRLAEKNDFVVAPEEYFSSSYPEEKGREMFVAPYHYQALCVGNEFGGFGYWTPVPNYHFEFFSPEQSHIVNAAMIANLIRLYDQERGQGVAACHLGGGDFILEKNWNQSNPTIADTMKKMSLIAARKMIDISLDDYINLIREEFSKPTIVLDGTECKLNIHSRQAMAKEDIELGIELGLSMRELLEK